jgi:2-keto-4-pentenoate hydratase/2-oxohepta-3-ene-1,7-dioic acid hydratase in catechol pathway
LGHIVALTLCNEGTIRNWVRHAKFNVTQGKHWDRSGGMGPWLVPYRDRRQIEDVALTTRVSGKIRQQDRTGRMLFPVGRQIAYISTFCTLWRLAISLSRARPPVPGRGLTRRFG